MLYSIGEMLQLEIVFVEKYILYPLRKYNAFL